MERYWLPKSLSLNPIPEYYYKQLLVPPYIKLEWIDLYSLQ